jgi:hypothetical protein
MNLVKYKENIILIILCVLVLTFYYLIDKKKKTERYTIRENKVIYDVINNCKIILKLSLMFNFKFILLGIISDLSV